MRILGNMTTKWCPRCKDFKDAVQFGADRHRPDGRHPYCRQCRKPFKQRDMQQEGATFYTGCDFPSRQSVPRDEQIRFDELTQQGYRCIVVDGSGQEHSWEDMD
jgi:hypothetical protein